jgi:lipoprotein-anchoring transpeptidase ErfK/SrfK
MRTTALAILFMLAAAVEAPAQFAGRSDGLFEPWRAGSASRRNPSPPSRGRVHAPPGSRSSAAVSSPTEFEEPGQPLPEHLQRRTVPFSTAESAGTIVVDTAGTYLYLVLGNGRALRYGIGVGREGFTWSGRERVSRMAEWPDWRPPNEMMERTPGLPDFVPGGLDNPLGARALYLGKTLYRIHGTNEPSTIGRFVSSGCIRMLNQDVIDLYRRVSVGTQVVVLHSTEGLASRQ